jgi:hypothetical protein
MRRTACSASLHQRTRALRRPPATIDSSEPAAGGLDRSEGFVKGHPPRPRKTYRGCLLHRRTRSCRECGVIRPVITALLDGRHHSNRYLLPNSKPRGFGECGVHTQNKKNSKVDLCFVFFNHFFFGSASCGITHQLTGGFYESQALRPYGRVIDGMYASSGTRDCLGSA